LVVDIFSIFYSVNSDRDFGMITM